MTDATRTSSPPGALSLLLLFALLALLFSASAAPARAQQRAVTADDRKVLLWPDGTWTYADQLKLPTSPIVLVSPPLSARFAEGQAAARRVTLRQISVSRNNITDEAAWFRDNGLALPTCEVPRQGRRGTCPTRTPAAYLRSPITQAIVGEKYALLMYGGGRYRDPRYLVLADRAMTKVDRVFDFGAYLAPWGVTGGHGTDMTLQALVWAEREGSTLYLSNGHRTYAKSSRGKNAYLSAIDLETNRLRWRSPPLTCNARNFVIVGAHIVCGYGFTAEPDFLYALDKRTGRVVAKARLKTGPDFIIKKGGRLYVRTYDRDYVFELVVR